MPRRKYLFDTDIITGKVFDAVKLLPAGQHFSCVVYSEVMTAADPKPFRAYVETWKRAAEDDKLIVPHPDDWLPATRILHLLAQERKKKAGGKSPSRTPAAKQELFADVLIALSAARAGVTVVTNDGDLLPQIHEELQRNQTGDRAAIERELQNALEQLRDLGVPEEKSEKVRTLRVKLENAMDVPRAARDVFNHLYNFFSRYYQSGDFLSLRRYKRDVYALPYEGEEVKLHWVNADQYYIKTGEYFRDYTFTLADGRRVHFKLAAADTEQNNNKANGDRERRFMLASEADFLRVENNELIINFAYQPDETKRKQADINRETVERIFAALGAGAPPPPAKTIKKGRGKKKDLSTKEHETTLNTDSATSADAATGAASASASFRAASGDFVDNSLLLWAKGLMQASPTAAYSEPLSPAFLEAQSHLVLDTSLFDRDFTERLLADGFNDLEKQTDGVLIESENFQALNLLQARYREQIKCIYIDPPYNTGGDDFNHAARRFARRTRPIPRRLYPSLFVPTRNGGQPFTAQSRSLREPVRLPPRHQ